MSVTAICAYCLLCIVASGVSNAVQLALIIPIGGLIIFSKQSDSKIDLLLFFTISAGAFSAQSTSYSSGTITACVAISLIAASKVTLDSIPNLLGSRHSELDNWARVWLGSAAITTAIIFLSLPDRPAGWTIPAHTVLCSSGAFLGYRIGLHKRINSRSMHKRLAYGLLAVGILGLTPLFHHRILWLGAALAPALALSPPKRSSNGYLLALTILYFVWFGYCILGISKSGGTTLTLMLLFTISTAMSAFHKLFRQNTRFALNTFSGSIAAILMIAFIIISIAGSQISSEAVDPTSIDAPLSERITFKMFDDRARVWASVLFDITTDSLLLPTSGGNFQFLHWSGDLVDKGHGAHNTYLQAIWKNGIIAGSIVVIFTLFLFVKSVSSLPRAKNRLTIALLISTLSNLTIGATTGHYIIGQEVGIFFYIFAGLALGLYTSERRELANTNLRN